MAYNEIPLRVNSAHHRLELDVEGHTAFIKYGLHESTLALIHTEVPPELGGKGVGPAIVQKAFEYAKEQGYTIRPICPFVQTFLKRHPEWEGMVEGKPSQE